MLDLSLQTVLTFSMPCNLLLKAREDALGKRNCYKKAFSDVALRFAGREAFYSPVRRSQYFSEPVPLGCKLHRCFSVFSSLEVGGDC